MHVCVLAMLMLLLCAVIIGLTEPSTWGGSTASPYLNGIDRFYMPRNCCDGSMYVLQQ